MHSEKKWNHDRKKLLIEIRLKYEPDFVAKKKKEEHTLGANNAGCEGNR